MVRTRLLDADRHRPSTVHVPFHAFCERPPIRSADRRHVPLYLQCVQSISWWHVRHPGLYRDRDRITAFSPPAGPPVSVPSRSAGPLTTGQLGLQSYRWLQPRGKIGSSITVTSGTVRSRLATPIPSFTGLPPHDSGTLPTSMR